MHLPLLACLCLSQPPTAPIHVTPAHAHMDIVHVHGHPHWPCLLLVLSCSEGLVGHVVSFKSDMRAQLGALHGYVVPVVTNHKFVFGG